MSPSNEVPTRDLLARLPASNFGEPTPFIATPRTNISLNGVRKNDLQSDLHSAGRKGPFGGHLIGAILAGKILPVLPEKDFGKFTLSMSVVPVPNGESQTLPRDRLVGAGLSLRS
jgi:hypothetical protein